MSETNDAELPHKNIMPVLKLERFKTLELQHEFSHNMDGSYQANETGNSVLENLIEEEDEEELFATPGTTPKVIQL